MPSRRGAPEDAHAPPMSAADFALFDENVPPNAHRRVSNSGATFQPARV